MRTSAKILRMIGRSLTWPATGYAVPWRLGPWYRYHYFRSVNR